MKAVCYHGKEDVRVKTVPASGDFSAFPSRRKRLPQQLAPTVTWHPVCPVSFDLT
jgi:Alcohol dehydrogenase GroES-associated